MLQLYAAPGDAPWGADEEATYRDFLSRLEDTARPATRPLPYADAAMEQFDHLRLAKLVHYLRGRAPDAAVAGSILVYRLTDAEVEEALAF